MIAFWAFFLFGCIHFYSQFGALEYQDIVHEELTFERYEVKRRLKGGDRYFIYVQEYTNSFEITGIAQRKLDKSALEKLESGTSVEIYYDVGCSICEMKSGSDTLLSLSDYKEVNQNNQKAGIILCPIMIASVLFLILIFSRMYLPSYKSDRKRKQKN